MRFIQFALLYLLCSLFLTSGAQEAEADKGLIFKAATEIIGHEKYCALITLNETGQPQARMMEPFPPEEDFVIWFGTNKNSRKVREIKNDDRVTVYYADEAGNGYVVVTGRAVLVDDPGEKERRWMEHWARFYPNRENYLLIKVIPKSMEVVSYAHDLTGDSVTWRAPHIVID
ncbi:MAG: pyridoxamine 5'-phosphate oxidase family protein [Bacteroidales bacterium]|nr:pyridoxamine 5'-phosphate oxidase family protein [Bacteroidales bacterium]